MREFHKREFDQPCWIWGGNSRRSCRSKRPLDWGGLLADTRWPIARAAAAAWSARQDLCWGNSRTAIAWQGSAWCGRSPRRCWRWWRGSLWCRYTRGSCRATVKTLVIVWLVITELLKLFLKPARRCCWSGPGARDRCYHNLTVHRFDQNLIFDLVIPLKSTLNGTLPDHRHHLRPAAHNLHIEQVSILWA